MKPDSAPAAPLVSDERRRWLERYVRWLGADPELAADITQEALLRLWQAPPEGTGERVIGAWLRTVARNLFRNSVAKARHGVPLEDPTLLEQAWRQFMEADRDNAMGDALSRCLDTLPDRDRQVLQLRYRHELSQDELARVLGMSTSGAKRLLARLRRKLADCIEKRMKT